MGWNERDYVVLVNTSNQGSFVEEYECQLDDNESLMNDSDQEKNIEMFMNSGEHSDNEFNKQLIMELLPDQYSYHVVKFEVVSTNTSDLNFELETRVNVTAVDEVKHFLELLNGSTGCTYNIQSGRPDRIQDGAASRSKIRGFRKCCLNVSNNAEKKPKQEGKNTKCKSTVNFRLENPSSGSKSLQADREKYPLLIQIHFVHNHALNRAEYLRYLSVSQATKDSFTDMFESDLTPGAALEEERRKIKEEFPESWPQHFADKSKLPGLFWAHYWYKLWLDAKFGSRDGVDACVKAEKAVEAFDEDCKSRYPLSEGESYAKMAQSPDGQTVVAICDPFMRRVHQIIPQSGELILMDATSNLDRNDTKLFHLYCPSSIGGLPVAELITTREDGPTIAFALQVLKSVLPAGAFYGRGREVGPVLFMTDDCDAETNALSAVWPQAELLLCQFHFVGYSHN